MRLLREQDELILVAQMGSFAYGMATPESDVDLLGVYVAPTEDFLGVADPTKKDMTAHKAVVGGDDFTYHELAKYCGGALGANPTLLELLWVDEYMTLNPWGKVLIDNREAFLSNTVRNSFGGYALQQAKKLEKRQDEGREGYDSNLKNRFAKHTRHCFRLLRQGAELLTTGQMRVRLTQEERDDLFALGESSPEEFIARFKEEFAKFDALPSVLPDRPDVERVDNMVREIRLARL
jgi:predicted nucleotidyltransferase